MFCRITPIIVGTTITTERNHFCGKVQGTFAAKVGNCMRCKFYESVATEEGYGFVTSKAILAKLG